MLEFDRAGSFVRVAASGIVEPTHLAMAYICDPDCTGNGSLDAWEIASGTSRDLNNNGIPDECEDCVGDLTGDGIIGLDDLARLLSNFGRSGVSYSDGDITGDGVVSLSDLAALLTRFGAVCP